MTRKTKLAIGVAASIVVLAVVIAIVTSAFGSQKLPVDSTVEVKFSGANGYGTASIVDEWEWQDTIKFQKNKNNTPLESMGYKLVLQQCIEYSLSKDADLSNGEVVTLKISVDKDVLKQYGFKAKDVTKKIKVSGLTKVKEINPFKDGKVELEIYGLSGAGSLGDYNNHVQINLGKDEVLDLDLELLNKEELNGKLANGDKVSVKITDDYSNADLANNYGIVFTEREADIVVDNMNYYPTENPREIFEYLGKNDLKNVATALKGEYATDKNLGSEYDVGNVEVEYVGAVYYYTDPINFGEANYDKNNQLVLIYHVTNNIVPGGWYTYMAPTKGVYIRHQEKEDGTFEKITTMGSGNSGFDVFPDKGGNYSTDMLRLWEVLEVPTTFKYGEVYYEGHQTLEECIKAFTYHKITNEKATIGGIIKKPYNHVVATENLKEYVEEY